MTEMPKLPHHKLIAFGVARDLLLAVRAAQVRDAKLRDEALRSAKSACLNCAYAEFGISTVMPHARLCRVHRRPPR